jgi:phosphoglycerate dehydrogenase-like enzyme
VELARILGMGVLIAERKGAKACREDRTPFEEVLRFSTVLVVIVPRTPDTVDMIGFKELEWMRHDAVLVNVSRGGIVNKLALLETLKKGWIGGAAVDVFAEEPATEDNCWLIGNVAKGLNLITTPHTAWAGMATEAGLRRMAKENIENWVRGERSNVVV